MVHVTRTSTNHLIPCVMDYNTTAVNSTQNMHPMAHLSNSCRTPGFWSIVQLNGSITPQILSRITVANGTT